MSRSFEYLDLEDVLSLARTLLGDPPPIRDIGLLGSAVARPQTSVFGEDAYPDVYSKAAALLQSIVNNHPLVDGNKRLAWSATKVFLLINGEQITYDVDDAEKVVVGVASGTYSLEQLTDWLVRATAK